MVMEPLRPFILIATNGEHPPILNRADWVTWIEMVDRTAQECYSLKAVGHSLPTDKASSYVAVGLATATQLERMHETLREIRSNWPVGEVCLTTADDIDNTI